MTKQGNQPVPESVEEWFASRGFTVAISEESGFFWAGLVTASGRLAAPKYRRGSTPAGAAQRAKQRYLRQQRHSPPSAGLPIHPLGDIAAR
jgi:hypothetical protein